MRCTPCYSYPPALFLLARPLTCTSARSNPNLSASLQSHIRYPTNALYGLFCSWSIWSGSLTSPAIYSVSTALFTSYGTLRISNLAALLSFSFSIVYQTRRSCSILVNIWWGWWLETYMTNIMTITRCEMYARNHKRGMRELLIGQCEWCAMAALFYTVNTIIIVTVPMWLSSIQAETVAALRMGLSCWMIKISALCCSTSSFCYCYYCYCFCYVGIISFELLPSLWISWRMP